MDLRKRRSMQLLWRALFDLMTEKKIGFSKITVDQICEKGMVHRSTFYKHFDDKFKLLEYGVSQLMEPYWDIPLEKRILNPFVWSNQFFEGSEADQLIHSQQNDELFFDCMHTFSMRFLKKDALRYIQDAKTIDIPDDLLAEFHVSTMVALSEWHRKNPHHASWVQMDQYFNRLVNDHIFEVK